MAQETMEHKTYSVEEALFIIAQNLRNLWENIPMKYKESLADPLAYNIDNLLGCADAMIQAKQKAEEQQKEAGQNEFEGEPEAADQAEHIKKQEVPEDGTEADTE